MNVWSKRREISFPFNLICLGYTLNFQTFLIRILSNSDLSSPQFSEEIKEHNHPCSQCTKLLHRWRKNSWPKRGGVFWERGKQLVERNKCSSGNESNQSSIHTRCLEESWHYTAHCEKQTVGRCLHIRCRLWRRHFKWSKKLMTLC